MLFPIAAAHFYIPTNAALQLLHLLFVTVAILMGMKGSPLYTHTSAHLLPLSRASWSSFHITTYGLTSFLSTVT